MKKLIIAIALVCVGFSAQAQVKYREKEIKISPNQGSVLTPRQQIDKNLVIKPQKEKLGVAVPILGVAVAFTSQKGKMKMLISPNKKFELGSSTSEFALMEILQEPYSKDGIDYTRISTRVWLGEMTSPRPVSTDIISFEIDESLKVNFSNGISTTISGVPKLPKGSSLELNDNGNLLIRTPDGNIPWQTNTGKK